MIKFSADQREFRPLTGTVKPIRERDIDAVELCIMVPEPEVGYLIHHGLGRVATRVSIEWKEQPCDYGVIYDAKGTPISDNDKIGLWFTEGKVKLRLRVA